MIATRNMATTHAMHPPPEILEILELCQSEYTLHERLGFGTNCVRAFAQAQIGASSLTPSNSISL